MANGCIIKSHNSTSAPQTRSDKGYCLYARDGPETSQRQGCESEKELHTKHEDIGVDLEEREEG